MIINGLQKLTLLDFPEKTAATIFLAGCNLRCPFCHNSRLVVGEGFEKIPEEELFSYLEKRQGILDGVCITGGEPLMREELFEFIEKIRALGYQVKLDTNGTFPDRLSSLLENGLLDYVAMDIKNSPEKYALTVGVENFDVTPVLKSIEILKSSGVNHEFRTTLVKELHEEEDVEKMAKLLSPDSKYFLQKFVDSGEILSDGLSPLSDEISQKYLKTAQALVPFAQLRGI